MKAEDFVIKWLVDHTSPEELAETTEAEQSHFIHLLICLVADRDKQIAEKVQEVIDTPYPDCIDKILELKRLLEE